MTNPLFIYSFILYISVLSVDLFPASLLACLGIQFCEQGKAEV
jgi:hypothetical protein